MPVHQRLGEKAELDFFDVVEGVWKQRVVVLLCVVCLGALGFAYAQFAKPVYEAKLIVEPPLQSDIAVLNFGRGGGKYELPPISAKQVGESFQRTLQSEAVRRKFFEEIFSRGAAENTQGAATAESYAQLARQLTVQPSSEQAGKLTLVATASNPEQAAGWLEAYVSLAEKATKKDVIEGVKSEASTMANNLDHSIIASRENAKDARLDRIAQLREAYMQAMAIGLEKPPIIANGLSGEVSAGMNGSLMYMRGSKALDAEINNLEARKSDDPFVSELRERQEAVAFYRSLEIKPEALHVYRQDGPINAGGSPVKPRKALIVGVSLLAGVFAGVLLALLRQAWWLRQPRAIA